MNLQRFAGPRAEDEMYFCSGCGEKFYHLLLDKNNECKDCREDKEGSDLFDRCVIRTCGGRSIRCCLGLWGVSAPNEATAEREARHYWQQYYADGEYESHLSSG